GVVRDRFVVVIGQHRRRRAHDQRGDPRDRGRHLRRRRGRERARIHRRRAHRPHAERARSPRRRRPLQRLTQREDFARVRRESVSKVLAKLPPAGTFDSDVILNAFLECVSEKGLSLYPAQEEALRELLSGKHVILSTPTGSGKSLVALGLHFKAMSEGKTSVYTAPIKALVSEKFFALCEDFGAAYVGMMTGDATINRDAPILCCTAEILAKLALEDGALRVSAVVMDEFHYYGDKDRGMAWQVPLLTMPHAQFLLMSATL